MVCRYVEGWFPGEVGMELRMENEGTADVCLFEKAKPKLFICFFSFGKKEEGMWMSRTGVNLFAQM